jgi:dihydroflavonol-4-reductase
MRVLFTGASSVPGRRVLDQLFARKDFSEIWCAVHKQDVALEHPKLRKLPLDLTSPVCLDTIPPPLDLVIHFAAVTHAVDETAYWEVNLQGTRRLAEQAQALGCRRFLYVSTRCAVAGNGAYGESKLAGEEALKKMTWDSLLILQPAELYGGGSREGLDKFVWLAARLHVVPLLWGNQNIQFAPVHLDDFVECVCRLIGNEAKGVETVELCGPESLHGASLALRLARKYKALPLPVWWPAAKLILKALSVAGLHPVTPDQISRLVGPKTASACSEACTSSRMIQFPQNANV